MIGGHQSPFGGRVWAPSPAGQDEGLFWTLAGAALSLKLGKSVCVWLWGWGEAMSRSEDVKLEARVPGDTQGQGCGVQHQLHTPCMVLGPLCEATALGSPECSQAAVHPLGCPASPVASASSSVPTPAAPGKCKADGCWALHSPQAWPSSWHPTQQGPALTRDFHFSKLKTASGLGSLSPVHCLAKQLAPWMKTSHCTVLIQAKPSAPVLYLGVVPCL
jgi:hypothetical protein